VIGAFVSGCIACPHRYMTLQNAAPRTHAGYLRGAQYRCDGF
jgi:hypothetical protein